jgi:prepilin-type processing-associated H-X9-DG protein/prepilin-type N-terminal cleavage/methylation domain-containing protein
MAATGTWRRLRMKLKNLAFPPNAFLHRSAFTLVELLITIAIVGILASLLLPATKSMIAHGRSVKCASNLRQIGIGMNLYANEHDGMFPSMYNPANGDSFTWMRKVAPYLGMSDNEMGLAPLPRAAGVFICPEWKMGPDRAVSYGLSPFINPSLRPYSWNYRRAKVSAAKTFLVVEMESNYDYPPNDGVVSRRHPNTSANYLFVDGHVENIREIVPANDSRWTKPEYQ